MLKGRTSRFETPFLKGPYCSGVENRPFGALRNLNLLYGASSNLYAHDEQPVTLHMRGTRHRGGILVWERRSPKAPPMWHCKTNKIVAIANGGRVIATS